MKKIPGMSRMTTMQDIKMIIQKNITKKIKMREMNCNNQRQKINWKFYMNKKNHMRHME